MSVMSQIYPVELRGYVLIKRMQIINANAISSPLTYGFPAITGFTGAVHNLSRNINQIDELKGIYLDGVVLACHQCQVQTYRENQYKDFSFIQTRNPLLKTGKTAPIIEEGKCHLTVSLIIGVHSDEFLSEEKIELLQSSILKLAQQQRFAGGSVMGLDKKNPIQFCEADYLDEKFKSQLLPAFVLVNAHNDLLEITQELQKDNPNATALDTLMETAVLRHIPDEKQPSGWRTDSVKKGRGWLVPIPVGYQGISPIFQAAELKNSRNPEYPSQYVESIYSLGKWLFPHRIDYLATAVWYPCYDDDKQLYWVQQFEEF